MDYLATIIWVTLIAAVTVARQAFCACLVEFKPRLVIVPGSLPEIQDVIESSNCPHPIQAKARDLISTLQGRPSAAYLASALDEVQVAPLHVELISLQDIATKALGSGKSLKTVSFANGQSVLGLPPGEFIQAYCLQCPPSGQGLIELSVGGRQKHWIRASYTARANALVTKRPISNLSDTFTPADVEEREMDIDDPALLFKDVQALRFHRPARPLAAGTPLTIRDMVATFAVTPAGPVEVIYSSSGVNLSSKGTALGSARIGERVDIRSQNSRRILQGKVIDFNKVDLAL